MTDKELLRGEIRETIRLYRLGLNKKTLEALVDDMEAIFKQEIASKIKEIIKIRERYKCGACDSKTSNLSHTMLCSAFVDVIKTFEGKKENNDKV